MEPEWYEIPWIWIRRYVYKEVCFTIYKLPYFRTGMKIIAWCIENEPYPDWPQPETK
jgi:hypothetical protein